MAGLEEMRQAYCSQRESVTLSAVLDRCGGWYLEHAKTYAAWVGPAPDPHHCQIQMTIKVLAKHARKY